MCSCSHDNIIFRKVDIYRSIGLVSIKMNFNSFDCLTMESIWGADHDFLVVIALYNLNHLLSAKNFEHHFPLLLISKKEFRKKKSALRLVATLNQILPHLSPSFGGRRQGKPENCSPKWCYGDIEMLSLILNVYIWIQCHLNIDVLQNNVSHCIMHSQVLH